MLRAADLIKVLGIEEISYILCELLESPFDWSPLREVNREVKASAVSPWAVSVRLCNHRVKYMSDGMIMVEAEQRDPNVDVIIWALHKCDFTHSVVSVAMSSLLSTLIKRRWDPLKAKWWDLGGVARQNIRRCLPSEDGLAMRATCRTRESAIRSFLIKRGCIKILFDALDVEDIKRAPLRYRDIAVLSSLLSYVCYQCRLRRYDCVDVVCHILDCHWTSSIVQTRCLGALRAFSRKSLSVLFKVNVVHRIKSALENHYICRDVVRMGCEFIISLCRNVVLDEEKIYLNECFRETEMIQCLLYCQHDCAEAGRVYVSIWRTIMALVRVTEGVEHTEGILREVTSTLRMRCAKLGRCLRLSPRRNIDWRCFKMWGSVLVLVQLLDLIICEQGKTCSVNEDLMDLLMEFFGGIPHKFAVQCGFCHLCRVIESLASHVDWAEWICKGKVGVFLLQGIASRVGGFVHSRDVLMQICVATQLLPSVLFHDRSQHSLCVDELRFAMLVLMEEFSFQLIACHTIKELIWDEQTRHVIGECGPLYERVMAALTVHGNHYELREEACGALITLLAFYVRYGGSQDPSAVGIIVGELAKFPGDAYVRQQICDALGTSEQDRIGLIDSQWIMAREIA